MNVYSVRYIHKISPSEKDTMRVWISGNAFSDSRTLGKALRDANVFEPGTRLRTFRVEGNKTIVLPDRGIWHSAILVLEVPSTGTVPNMTDLSVDDLMAFWHKFHRPGQKLKRELLGEREGNFRLTSLLACYASNMATVKRCRECGDEQGAYIYQTHCDLILERLPADLRAAVSRPRRANRK